MNPIKCCVVIADEVTDQLWSEVMFECRRAESSSPLHQKYTVAMETLVLGNFVNLYARVNVNS